MNKKIDSILSIYKHKTGRSVSRVKNSKSKKLPALSHNTSSLKITPTITSNRSGHSSKLPEREVQKTEENKKYSKLKSFSSMDDDFERLELISHKHQMIRNNSINIQQRLIEIASSAKLPIIKEKGTSFITEQKLNANVDSVLQRYQENFKQKIKLLEGFSSNL
jgi:hypothetical protein